MFSASSEQSSLSQAKLLVTHRGPRVKCHVHFVLYIVQACFFFAKQITLDLRSNAIMSIVNIVLGLHLKHCSKFSINTIARSRISVITAVNATQPSELLGTCRSHAGSVLMVTLARHIICCVLTNQLGDWDNVCKL